MMRRKNAIWLGLFLLVAAVAKGAEARPERAEVDGKQGYIYGGRWYRLLPLAERDELKTGVKVCVTGKVADVQGDIVTLYPPWDKIPFKLAAASRARPQAGENLWIGGEIRGAGEQRFFQVEALAVLPSDLAMAKERWQEIEKKPQPDAFLRLAWDLEQAERFMPPGQQSESEAMQEMIRRCYGRGLELEEKDLAAADDTALARRLARYRQAAARPALPGNEGRWSDACRELLRLNAQAADALTSGGKCDESQRRQIIAGIYFLLAKMQSEFLQDKEAAKRLLAAAAELAPSYPGVSEQLRRLGIKPQDKPEPKAEGAKKAKEETAKRPTSESDSAALGKWRHAEGAEKKVTVVDALLAQPTAANVAELARKLETLPLEAAALPLWQAALTSKEVALRRDAMALLIASAEAEAQKAAVEAIGREKDTAFLAWIFEAIQHLPQPGQRINILIQILSSQAPRPTRQTALTLLEKETGQSLGLDHLKWQEWWQRHGGEAVVPPNMR